MTPIKLAIICGWVGGFNLTLIPIDLAKGDLMWAVASTACTLFCAWACYVNYKLAVEGETE